MTSVESNPDGKNEFLLERGVSSGFIPAPGRPEPTAIDRSLNQSGQA